MKYLLVLGNDGELQRVEIEAIFGKNNAEKISDWPLMRVETEKTPDFNILGGIVKAGEVIGEYDNQEEAILTIKNKIQEEGIKNFGISGYGVNSGKIFDWCKEIKKEAQGKIRFNIASEGSLLSNVAVVKKKITEFVLVKTESKYLLAKTMWVFDFEEWGKRDFGKPARNIKQGMLTPKAARMMINLARLFDRGEVTLLDPFCGTGTILMEGTILGYNISGNDLDKEQIERTRKNLEWLGIENYQLFNTDAANVSTMIKPNSIDAIVTEPYLGPLIEAGREPQEDKIKRIIDGLERMYIGCFHDWQKVLKPQGTIVIVFPAFFIKDKTYRCEKPLDRCESMGYIVTSGPYHYGYSNAIVKREIYVLKKS